MRIREAVRHLWGQGVIAHEALLARPWEREGELHWRADLGGPRLLGRDLPAAGPGPMADAAAVPAPRSSLRAPGSG